MDWSAFFAAAGLARQEAFVAWQPTAVTGVAALVASQPLETWKDYLRFHVVDGYADVLPRAFAEQALAMREARDRPAGAELARPARLEATQVAMSDALGRMYAERYFPAEQKARVEAIVAQRHCGVPPTGRGGDLDVARHQDAGAGQAEDAVRRHRLSGHMAGLFRPGRGPARTPSAIFGGSRTATTVVPWLGWAGPWT